MAVNISNSNTNKVNVSSNDKKITITNTPGDTTVDITTTETSTLTITSQGPKGPKGDPGENRLNTLSSNVISQHITASGNVLVGGDILTTNITSSNILLGSSIIHDNDPDTFISFGINTIRFSAGGESIFRTDKNISGRNTLSASGDFIAANITASANISASGTVTAGGVTINGNSILNSGTITLGVDSGDRINANAFFATRIYTTSHVTASGNISAGGIITGSNLKGTNTGDQDLSGFLSSSSQISSDISGSFNIVSASLASETSQLLNFSTSLDTTFATDAELSAVSSSFATTINNIQHTDITALNTFSGSANTKITNLESFSSSLDTIYATQTQLNVSSSELRNDLVANTATSSFALTGSSVLFGNITASIISASSELIGTINGGTF